MQTSRRSRCAVVLVGMLASAAGVAIAAEPAAPKKTPKHASAPPKPGPDGWYDALPIDGSFVVRIPGVYQVFTEDGKPEAGVTTHLVGVRANVSAAFGGVTSYAASCISQKGDARTPKQRLQTAIDHWETLGPMRFRRPIHSEAGAGFEFEMADDVKVVRARVYAPKLGTCTVLMSWRPYARPSDADIDKYLDSFEVTTR